MKGGVEGRGNRYENERMENRRMNEKTAEQIEERLIYVNLTIELHRET